MFLFALSIASTVVCVCCVMLTGRVIAGQFETAALRRHVGAVLGLLILMGVTIAILEVWLRPHIDPHAIPRILYWTHTAMVSGMDAALFCVLGERLWAWRRDALSNPARKTFHYWGVRVFLALALAASVTGVLVFRSATILQSRQSPGHFLSPRRSGI